MTMPAGLKKGGAPPADCLLGAKLKVTITASLCLSQLPGFARACGPQCHGRTCEWTAARLDLPLDANGSRRRAAHQADQCAHQENCGYVDFSHLSH